MPEKIRLSKLVTPLSIRLAAALLIILLFNNTNSFAQQQYFHKAFLTHKLHHNIVRKLDRYLSEFYQAKNIASISAGVSENGKILWASSRGYADIGNKVEARPNTIYRIASISKMITAVAIMQLVEKEKIKLDDDARKYIPYFPKKKWKFTIRQILQHTAGLRTYKTGEFNSTVNYNSTRQVVDLISKDPLVSKPGTNYLYTTLGYNLLAAIIENVSGLSFDEYLRRNIFNPAGMYSTDLEFQKEIVENKARPYDKNIYRIIQNAPLADLSIKYAGGGVISDVDDVLKFADNLLKGKLLSPALLDTMLVPTKLANGKVISNGLGFELFKDKENNFCYGHYGHGTGFTSLLVIYPQDSVTAVHLINTVEEQPETAAFDLASIVLGHEYSLPLKPLSDKMMLVARSSGIDSAIACCRFIQKDSAAFYDLSANQFNIFGYDLLKIKKHFDAIKWFHFFAEVYPTSTSAYIGLGDSYYNDKNIGLALKAYRRVLAKDVYNKYALKMIKTLELD